MVLFMHQSYYYIKKRLHKWGEEAERTAIAKHLLSEVIGLSTASLYAGVGGELSPECYEQIDSIIDRLLKNEPLQYILGEAVFYGRSYKVNPGVLIPRPETAELVEWVVNTYRGEEARILDIGTGSGCIAISIAKELPATCVEAWDISMPALEVAKENAQRHKVKVLLKQVDICNPTEFSPSSFHCIVSNPPYITAAEKAEMEAHVLDWEPHIALFAPDGDALCFYRAIAEQARTLLLPQGSLFFEINAEYATEVVKLLESLSYRDIIIRKDIYGKDRMVKAIK